MGLRAGGVGAGGVGAGAQLGVLGLLGVARRRGLVEDAVAVAAGLARGRRRGRAVGWGGAAAVGGVVRVGGARWRVGEGGGGRGGAGWGGEEGRVVSCVCGLGCAPSMVVRQV